MFLNRWVGVPLVAFLLLAGAPHAEGGRLSGRVWNARTGAPLEGASVVVEESGVGAETVAGGWFEVRRVAPGVYTVRVSHVGFRDRVQTGVVVPETGVVVVEFSMHPEAIPLDELEVVAEPVGPADIHRLPAFVTVLERKAFEGRATSVPELLSTATGVQVKRLGGLGSFSSISVRGSSAEQVEVYLDGVSLNPALGGGVNLSNLPLANVEQIEVYRGAAAEGSGLGGAVHIRTRSALEGQQYGGSGSWGSFDTRGVNAMVSDRREQGEYLVVADYAASDNDFRFLDDNGTEYNLNDDVPARRENGQFVSGSVLGKWGRRGRKGRITLQENLFWKRQGIPGISNNQSRNARLNTFRGLTEIGVMIPNWLERFSVQQRVFLTHRAESFLDRQGEVGLGRQDNLYRTRSYGWRGALKTALDAGHAGALEVSLRRETFLPEARLQRAGGSFESSRQTASGRVGGDWIMPKGRGIVSASATAEYQKSHVFEESPYLFSPLAPDTTTGRSLVSLRGGVRFDLRPGLWLKANAGRSQRAPSFYELFGNRGGVIGNTDLKSERGMTWDVGFRAQSGDGAVLEGVYFDHRYTDLIQFVQFSQGVARAQNIGKARVQGIETTLRGVLFGRWTVSGNYTYQRALDRSEVAHRRGKQLSNRPAHEAHAHTGFVLGRWAVFYDYTFEDGNFLDRANLRPVPARQIHNAGLRWSTFRQVRLTLEAKNLRNDQIADLWGYPLPGRSYFVTLQENF